MTATILSFVLFISALVPKSSGLNSTCNPEEIQTDDEIYIEYCYTPFEVGFDSINLAYAFLLRPIVTQLPSEYTYTESEKYEECKLYCEAKS